jgi:hypothetical protein
MKKMFDYLYYLKQQILKYKFIITLLFIMYIYAIFSVYVYYNFSFMSTDGSIYAILGNNLATKFSYELFGYPHTIFSPVLPGLIAISQLLGVSSSVSAYFTSITVSVLALPAVYVLSRRFASRFESIVSVFIYASFGFVLWSFSVVPTAQAVANLLSIITLIILDSVINKPNYINTLFLGLITSLIYLTRPEYLLYVFGILIVVLFSKAILKNRKVFTIAIFLGIWFLIVGLYSYYSFSKTGSVIGRLPEAVTVVTTGYDSVSEVLVNGSTKSPLISPLIDKQSVLTKLNANIFEVVKKFAKGLWQSEKSILGQLGFIGCLLLFIGFFTNQNRLLNSRYLRLLFLTFLPLPAIALVQGGSPNYVVQFMYILALPISLGLLAMLNYVDFRIKNTHWSLFIKILFILTTTTYFLMPIIQNVLFLPVDYRPEEIKKLGNWLKNHDEELVVVASRKPEIVFYSNSYWVELPNILNENDLKYFFVNNNVKYLVIDDRDTKNLLPGVFDIFTKNQPTWAKLIHSEKYGRYSAFLYTLDSLYEN